jgi:membrane protease subunit HflK
MPWNDNSNPGPKPGPWGSPPPSGSGGDKGDAPKGEGKQPIKGPWGGPPSGGGGPRRPQPPRRPGQGGPGNGPDLSDVLRRLSERARQTFTRPGGGGLQPRAVGLAAGAVGLLWLFSGVYAVQGNEEAVITRFGAYDRSTGPGLGYHLPAPIESVEKVRLTDLRVVNIGGQDAEDRLDESQMLTADENIVDLDFTVQWRVGDADKYLFNVAEPEATVKMVAESAMREVVGKTALDPIISTGRGRVQQQTQALMQSVLDGYNSGVQVVEVQIRNANPPREVIQAFREVASASQDAESSINEANTYRNRVVNEAKGDGARIRQASEGYRERVVREAEGSASRFNQVYAEYSQAPNVTRDRIYLETMERVLRQSNKVIVDGDAASAPIILPPDVFRARGAGSENQGGAAATQVAPNTATPNATQGAPR